MLRAIYMSRVTLWNMLEASLMVLEKIFFIVVDLIDFFCERKNTHF